jgi:hypothetical protein
MADEQNKGGSGGSESENANHISVDRAEYDALIASRERIAKLDALAQEAQRQNAEDYLNLLEEVAYENLQGEKKEEKEEQRIEKKIEPKTQQEKPDNEIVKRLDRTEQASAQVMLQAMALDYEFDNRMKPEDQRFPQTRQDLEKAIKGPDGSVIFHLAQKKFEGNLFKAAAHLLNIETVEERARKEGERLAGLSSSERESAALRLSGQLKPSEKMTAEGAYQEYQKREADKIAPDTVYKMAK